MSYENTACPCGGKKEHETMICPECEIVLSQNSDHAFSLSRYKDDSFTTGQRRSMAISILSAARRRTKRLALQFS